MAGTLKLDLAQFRELEAFATFGSELDAVSKAQLERGARLVELLKQGLHAPMAVEEQVVSIYAGTNGYLDDIPASDVKRFETELLDFMRTRHADIDEHDPRHGRAAAEDTTRATRLRPVQTRLQHGVERTSDATCAERRRSVRSPAIGDPRAGTPRERIAWLVVRSAFFAGGSSRSRPRRRSRAPWS